MTRLYRAAWVLPIEGPPIPDGWIEVRDGRVAALGAARERPPAAPADVPQVAIVPALVNAHVHLELSWMRGLVPAGDSMPAWASALIALRRSSTTDPYPAIVAAIRESRAAGTTLVGDVANSVETIAPLSDSALSAVVFRELIGFRVDEPLPMIAQAERESASIPRAARVRTVLAPHAPYSVSPALLRALRAQRPLSIHLGESRAEVEFLRTGSGPWRGVLEAVGAWSPTWQAPEAGPIDYIERLGLLNAHLLVVHAVQLTNEELRRLAGAGATIVTCPRSNEWTGAGTPPMEAFYSSGARVAIGTDSLASVATLSVFDEMAAVRRIAPSVPAARILQSATLDGAAALGFDDLGAISPGRRAELLAVQLPHTLSTAADVEQYLVSGVPPEGVSWLHIEP